MYILFGLLLQHTHHKQHTHTYTLHIHMTSQLNSHACCLSFCSRMSLSPCSFCVHIVLSITSFATSAMQTVYQQQYNNSTINYIINNNTTPLIWLCIPSECTRYNTRFRMHFRVSSSWSNNSQLLILRFIIWPSSHPLYVFSLVSPPVTYACKQSIC